MIKAESILFLVTLSAYFVTMLLYFLYVAVKKPALSKLAVRVQVFTLLVHTAAIILRGIQMVGDAGVPESPMTLLPVLSA